MMTVPLQTEQLARRVAALSGLTPEEVLRKAVEAEALLVGLAVVDDVGPVTRKVDPQRAREIAHRVASRPLRDARPPKAILDDAWGRAG